VRNRRALGDLTEDVILRFADVYYSTHGTWPRQDSGPIPDTHETWIGIAVALKNGARDLPRSITLADLLSEKRGVRNKSSLPSLREEEILAWADAHHASSGKWPNSKSGEKAGGQETWSGVQGALHSGRRGLPGGSSIALLLHQHRDVTHLAHRPKLSTAQVLDWADRHRKATGRWPKVHDKSPIPGTVDTWATVASALAAGKRGLPKISLSSLLSQHRGIRNHLAAPGLSASKILAWAKQHKRITGNWPTAESGDICGVAGEKWSSVQAALSQGNRGLPGGDSLARLLHREIGVEHRLARHRLNQALILRWADRHFRRHGIWPTVHDRRPPADGETWAALNAALERGSRGLSGGSSLALLLAKSGRIARGQHATRLSLRTIAAWAKSHRKRTGKWPSLSAGRIGATRERWNNIDQCLRKGLRGLPGGSSLAEVLATHCGAQNHLTLGSLSERQILKWASHHLRLTGSPPTKTSGKVGVTSEVWARINTSLKVGNRGLKGGSSLAKLLRKHRKFASAKTSN